MPSTPSETCTNAPNLAWFVTGPTMTEPTASFSPTSTHGSPSACLRPSDMRRSSDFTPRITASTVSPGFTTSLAILTFLDHDISDTWIKPSMPGSSSTNAPNSTTRVTVPRTRSLNLYFSVTESHGFG